MTFDGKCLCPNCFQSKLEESGRCPFCGYDPVLEPNRYPLALPSGSVLNGKYIIGRVLGQGGFGITYLAWDYILRIKTAVKEFLPSGMVSREPGRPEVIVYQGEQEESFRYGLNSFLDEAKVLARFIGHPNIVRVHSFFQENNTAYLVMEYIQGNSLKQYIAEQGGQVSWQDALRLLCPVAKALSAMHQQGILHRDVAPDNIILTPDVQVKLIDFGAARYSLGNRSRSLDVILKAGYAPKEQYTRNGVQGFYTDVYSLAACFYAAITGFVPPESQDRLEEDRLVPISQRGISIPEGLEQTILKGLAVQARDRYQTMGDFLQALVLYLPKEPTPPSPEPVIDDTGKKDADPPLPPPSPRRKHRTFIISGCCAAVLVLGLGLFAFWRMRSASDPVEPPAPVYPTDSSVSPSLPADVPVNSISSGTGTLSDVADRLTSMTIGGKIKLEPEQAAPGKPVVVTVTPNAGYKLQNLEVLDETGSPVHLFDVGNGQYSFTMPSTSVSVKPTYEKEYPPFTDVQWDAWFADAIWFVTSHGIMSGINSETFGLDGTLTRSMIAQMLYNLEGNPVAAAASCSDVDPNSWCGDAIGWILESGVMAGYTDGTFHPDSKVTREQIALIAYNYASLRGGDMTARADLSAYSDGDQVQGYTKEAVSWAVSSGLLSGSGNNVLSPGKYANRVQGAIIIKRLYEILP